MRAWVVRGAVLAVLHAVAQTSLAAVSVYHQEALGVLRPVALVVLVLVALFAAALDGLRGRTEPAMLWLKASLLAGWAAGLLGVAGQATFVDQTGASALSSALTGGAAFTALLVLVPAVLGLMLARLFGAPSGDPDDAEDSDDADDPADSGDSADESIVDGEIDRPVRRRQRSAG